MLASPSVTVFNAGLTTKPTIYSDNGVTAIANPFTGNADGSYIFYVANGRYDIVPSKTGFTFTAAETSDVLFYDPGTAVGWRVGGLVGQNDGATPNTKYGYSADQVVLFAPSTGLTVVRTNTGTLTNDTGVAGPAANGRDNGAFAASNWIHFYFIWNGTTLATLSSAIAPPTGPTLPTGYTHWAYAGAVRYDATPVLVKTRMRGSWMAYETQVAALVAGTATVETSVSLTAIIPPNALSWNGGGRFYITSTAGGAATIFVPLRIISGSNYRDLQGQNLNAGNALVTLWPWTEDNIPNQAQSISYAVTNTSGTSGSIDINVFSYRVPNGGE